MAYKKKTWQEKMADKKNMPKVLKLESTFPCYKPAVKMGAKAGDQVVLVNPSEVAELMNKVPEGKLVTIYEICKSLARKFKVQACCSLTTGIFIMTAANAAEEAKSEGKKSDLPYWRTLKADGFLNEKYPGGAEAHKKLLEKEGYQIIPKGKRYFVENFEKYLVKL
jgi:alkylated DNA nucleotide flippase Atl1